MNLINYYLIVLKKIKKRGFTWFVYRMKQELRSPSNSFSKFIALALEAIRVKFRIKKRYNHVDDSSDYLLAFYDLNDKPVTYDFAFFLAWADTFTKIKGKNKFFVYFIMENNKKMNNWNNYNKFVDVNSKKWRFNHIIIPMVNIYPACMGYSVNDVSFVRSFDFNNEIIFPERYSATYNPPMIYYEILDTLRLKLFNGFMATTQSIIYINKWQQFKNINNPIVCITLRRYGFDASRNSNIEAWVQFADWISEKGFTPIFIPDTDSCWEPDDRIKNYQVFTEGCWNLELRLALYEMAYVNYFYSNGCAALAILNKKIRYIAMFPNIADSIHADGKAYQSYGWKENQKKINFAEKYQFISFKNDDFHNIKNEFIQFNEHHASI